MQVITLRNALASVAFAIDGKAKRNQIDIFADRIRVCAGSETDLSRFFNRLIATCNAKVSDVNSGNLLAVISAPVDHHTSILHWLTENNSFAAMLAFSKKEDVTEVLETIDISIDPESKTNAGRAIPRPEFNITIVASAESPISHGSDTKSGNATLFRRMQVLTDAGKIIELPYISGNAIRGTLRDIIADDFCRRLGLEPRRDHPPLALWFFHCLYSGGALSDNAKDTKAVDEWLGKNGSLDTDGTHRFRDAFPPLSLLGTAITNRILPGRINVGDFRPVCHEWNNGSDIPVHRLMGWEFLTRREDHENHAPDHNSSMIANTEVLIAGTNIEGGIDITPAATDLEISCLANALEIWQKQPIIGGLSARGFGKCRIEFDDDRPECCSGEEYREWIEANHSTILENMQSLNALAE